MIVTHATRFFQISDIVECRIETVLADMEVTALCDVPDDDPVTPETFIGKTQSIVESAAPTLTQQSINIEMAVFDIIKVNFVMSFVNRASRQMRLTNLAIYEIFCEHLKCIYYKFA